MISSLFREIGSSTIGPIGSRRWKDGKLVDALPVGSKIVLGQHETEMKRREHGSAETGGNPSAM